jgi:tRNA(Ile)-lysidine synthase
LKSFLTNQKVPSSNRKDIRVLLSGGQIVWIVGHRIDNRYKIDSQTSRVVHVKWRSKVSEEKAKDIR